MLCTKKSWSFMELYTDSTVICPFPLLLKHFWRLVCITLYMSMRFTPLTQIPLSWRLLIEPAMRSLWSSKPKSRWPQPMSRSRSWTSLQSAHGRDLDESYVNPIWKSRNPSHRCLQWNLTWAIYLKLSWLTNPLRCLARWQGLPREQDSSGVASTAEYTAYTGRS